jgi:uncharacterized protein YjiS (DUF1127 family)
MHDLDDPKLRPLSHEFARQARIQRSVLMQVYLREAARSISAWAHVFARACAGLVERLAAWQRLQRDIRALQQFDDHMLADIAVPRHDIERLVRDGRPATKSQIAVTYPRRQLRPVGATRKVRTKVEGSKAQTIDSVDRASTI